MTDTETLEKLLNAGEPWGLLSVLATLARAAEHLLGEHGCDVEGHEEFQSAAAAAREILRSFDAVPWPRGSAPVPERAVAAMQSVLSHMAERGVAHVRPRHGFLSREETRRLVEAWEGHGGGGRAPVLCWIQSTSDVRLLWVSVDERARKNDAGPDIGWIVTDVPGAYITRSLAIWPDGVEPWLRGPGKTPPYDPDGDVATAEDAAGLLRQLYADECDGVWRYEVRADRGVEGVGVIVVREARGDRERERVILSSHDASPGVMELAANAREMARGLVRAENDLRARDALVVAQAQELVAWRLAMDEARRDAPVNVQTPGSEGARLVMALLRARREADAWRERALRAESAR